MKSKWSFYGAEQPRALIWICWALFLALPVVLAMPEELWEKLDLSGIAITYFSFIAGILAVGCAIKLRSFLLVAQGIFIFCFPAYYVTMFFGG